MPITISASVAPKTRAQGFMRRLKTALEVVGDMKPTFERVFHPYMLEHMKDQFESSGGAGGSPWASLDREPLYAAMKRRAVGNAPVLRWPTAGEVLYPSLVSRGPSHIEKSGAARARFGTAVPHAAQLEKGGVGPYGERYPARKILVLGARRTADLMSLTRHDIEARIAKGRRPRVTT